MNGDNPTSTTAVSGCSYDESSFNFVVPASQVGVIVDNFEFTGYCWVTGGVSGAGYMNVSTYLTNTNNTFENLYFHGWTHLTPYANGGTAINGSTNQNLAVGDKFIGIVVDGSDSDPASGFGMFGGGYDIHNSIFRYICNGVITNETHVFHDNLIEHINACGDGETHPNGFEFNVESKATNAIYNNVLRFNDTVNGVVNANTCPSNLDYMFNNVVYGMTNAGNYWDIQSGTCGVSAATTWLFNNTWIFSVDNPTAGGPPSGSTVNFYNMHCVTPDLGTPQQCSSYQGTENYVTDVMMSTATATSQGYTSSETFAYSPVSNTAGTAGAGTNEESICSALTGSSDPLLQAAGTACKADTTFACSYSPTTHSVTCPARAPQLRPPTGNWDAGAYQAPPGGPSGLQATPH
jgi:hypothetical protein